eukprot:93952_1
MTNAYLSKSTTVNTMNTINSDDLCVVDEESNFNFGNNLTNLAAGNGIVMGDIINEMNTPGGDDIIDNTDDLQIFGESYEEQHENMNIILNAHSYIPPNIPPPPPPPLSPKQPSIQSETYNSD